MAMKPTEGSFADNALKHVVGGVWIDGCRLSYASQADFDSAKFGTQTDIRGGGFGSKRPSDGDVMAHGVEGNSSGRWPANVLLGHKEGCVLSGYETEKRTVGAKGGFERYNKKLAEAGYRPNEYQKEASEDGLEVSECTEQWDCVPGCVVGLLDEQSGILKSGRLGIGHVDHGKETGRYGTYGGREISKEFGNDSGGASRFFKQIGEFNEQDAH